MKGRIAGISLNSLEYLPAFGNHAVGVVEVVNRQAELLEFVSRTGSGWPASRATFCTAGTKRAMRMAMMAITTSSSIGVKAILLPDGRAVSADSVLVD